MLDELAMSQKKQETVSSLLSLVTERADDTQKEVERCAEGEGARVELRGKEKNI